MNQIQKIIVSVIFSIVIIYSSYWVIEWFSVVSDPLAWIIGIALAGLFNFTFWKSKPNPSE